LVAVGCAAGTAVAATGVCAMEGEKASMIAAASAQDRKHIEFIRGPLKLKNENSPNRKPEKAD